ncbi:MAG: transcriptional repressor LexA [Anaerolineae bacterium]
MARSERPLTQRQLEILKFIVQRIEERGSPPTIREIGEHKAVQISSTSVINYHLNKLKERGLIARDDRISRGLSITDKARHEFGGLFRPESRVRLPLLGRIAAGSPIPVPGDQDPDEWVEVTRDLVGGREDVFALVVRGTSMIDALINDGDIVVMQRAETANNGEMVAAWIVDREETTLKRYYHERDPERIRLQPMNPTMEPIYAAPSNVEIQGKVIAVIRTLDRSMLSSAA